ncbi:hypothetical protein N136_04470, partial [Leifsonia aquatica ATCC 14665]
RARRRARRRARSRVLTFVPNVANGAVRVDIRHECREFRGA